jgi:hypothetical protein
MGIAPTAESRRGGPSHAQAQFWTQAAGWFTMIEENLGVPFETTVLGVPVTVEGVDLNRSGQIVAVCKRGRIRPSLPILDLPLPAPLPVGAEWIEAYRRWRAEDDDMDTPLADSRSRPHLRRRQQPSYPRVPRRKMLVARPKLLGSDLGCGTGVKRRREIITGEFRSA